VNLEKFISDYRRNPLNFVRREFQTEPDAWQKEVLSLWADPAKQRIALVACKGPGKTAVLAWLVWHFLATRPYPKIACVSNSAANLADNLWAELAKWRSKSEFLTRAFEWTKTRIYAKAAPENWFCSARSWPQNSDQEQQASTLAGLHADYILFILDESGSIPDAVMITAEAALSAGIECRLVQAGNPEMVEGPLYHACTDRKHLWSVINITGDPEAANRSPRVNIEWARQMIEQFGRDNPWVMVNVLGQFPNSSINALITPEEVDASMHRYYTEMDYGDHPRVLGVDCALAGDDASVIFPRQGLQAFTPMLYRNITGTQGADIVARKWKDWKADACFVDNTGGFGSSWVDNLVRLGFAPIPIHFSEKSTNPRYYNKRTEIIFDLIDWIKRGGALPDIPELRASLIKTTYTFKGDKCIIEPKALLKQKLGFSPDHMDALATGFAAPVHKALRTINGWPIGQVAGGRFATQTHSDYNPLSREIARDKNR